MEESMSSLTNGLVSPFKWAKDVVTGTNAEYWETTNVNDGNRNNDTFYGSLMRTPTFDSVGINFNIGMQSEKKHSRRRIRPSFLANLDISVRVGVATVLSSIIQMRKDPYHEIDPTSRIQQWYFFPDWYYLGGLSYCAVAIIFAVCENFGGTLAEVCHAFFGVGFSLLYNIFLFRVINVELYDPNQPDPHEDYYRVERTITGNSYWVNQSNFFYVLPWVVLFVILVVVLPLHASTKKFALAYDLFFALTVLNPSDPLNGDQLKKEGDWYFHTDNILHNLELYFVVGAVGWALSLLIMLLPYPLFAITSLRQQIEEGSYEVVSILNLIVDAYCFQHKSGAAVKILAGKLDRMFKSATAREQRMKQLVDDVWWEQIIGLNYILKFNQSMLQSYLHLLSTLLSDLRSLYFAMELETYNGLHTRYMKSLQKDLHLLQRYSEDSLREISSSVSDCALTLDLKSVRDLTKHMERTLKHFRRTNDRILGDENLFTKDVESNLGLNLFLFSLNSFAASLTSFQDKHNASDYTVEGRLQQFMHSAFAEFTDANHYDRLHLVSALKLTVAICGGIFLAVYVFYFDSTTPAVVAYVMGNHIGGAFSVTVNRVGGVVAGCVIPSILQFFIAQICYPRYLNDILMNIVLFVWVTASMYVRFSSDYWWYGGLVSAYVAAIIFLKQTDVCLPGGTDSLADISSSSYSSLAQNSVGILLFILMELLVFPESSMSLLHKNIQRTFTLLRDSFDVLFTHHLSTSGEMKQDDLEEVRETLQMTMPALLAEQKSLIQEAAAEPALWKADFSKEKYEQVNDMCQRLLNNDNLLYKLMRWYSKRLEQHKIDQLKTEDIRDLHWSFTDDEIKRAVKWRETSQRFLGSVSDAFNDLNSVFSEDFLYAEADQIAVFMQMKEAFRLADKNCSGSIEKDEVENMLRNIMSVVSQTGAVKDEQVADYVDKFMSVVDRDNDGQVSLAEFMSALEDGLQFETSIYQLATPKTFILTDTAETETEPDILDILNTPNPPLTPVVEEEPWNGEITMSRQLPPPTSGETDFIRTPRFLSLLSPYARSETTDLETSMRRQHELLNMVDFSLKEYAGEMRSAFVEWMMEDNRFQQVAMEELILLTCLVSGAEGISRQLTELQETVFFG